jgi:hypothetical protein
VIMPSGSEMGHEKRNNSFYLRQDGEKLVFRLC